MRTLGIDTSNYATSLAVYDSVGGAPVMLKRFLPVKQGGLGLRQSDAVFHHTAALPQLFAELKQKTNLEELSAVGVSTRPRPAEGSYMPCFLVGQAAAAAISATAGIPLIETTHQQGHIAAALYAAGGDLYDKRALVFHISGGTTDLLLVDRLQVLRTVGHSTDLYAGQAVDRLGVRLGFDFPAGAQLSSLAAECEEEPDPKVSVKGTDCSLSGLQNQCEKLLAEGKAPAYAARYCLTAVAKTACLMLRAALEQEPGLPCVCAGGVMSSELIRDYVTRRLPGVRFVPGLYSSDNAAGAAIIAAREMERRDG